MSWASLVSATNKTVRRDITEILLKVVYKIIYQPRTNYKWVYQIINSLVSVNMSFYGPKEPTAALNIDFEFPKNHIKLNKTK